LIAPDRFIVQSENREAWLAARRGAVTATEVAKAATPAGFQEALDERRNPTEVIDNAYMKFGRDNENWIALDLKRKYGLMPNTWLIASKDDPRHMATPDLLSLDHSIIGEVKTGGTEPKNPPLAHVRQMQWQLYCAGPQAKNCIYGFMLRAENAEGFYPAWMWPKAWVVKRDDEMITELIGVANRLLEEDK
jgi:hypothetical protein